ncbi:hypothetical protein [uncultured Clostridium sp.]|uniref:hypothetical protein n=1 Tax=uncultured Clostridium sp. TaxID=59620 RepID=UPI0028E91BBE|nr:hypothetical protein [uncultured Clostridium sp.]
MKKFYMFVLTGIMLLITTGAYFYENSYEVPKYNAPTFNIESKKFGTIKDMQFIKYAENPILIILSSTREGDDEYSNLHYLDVEKGEVGHIGKFESHKYLNNHVTLPYTLNQPQIIAFTPKGYITFPYQQKTKAEYLKDNHHLEKEILNFKDSTHVTVEYSIAFSKEGHSNIYNYNFYSGLNNLFGYNDSSNFSTVYLGSSPIIKPVSYTENEILYIAPKKGKLNLYSFKTSYKKSLLNKPIIENVVNVENDFKSQKLIGFTLKDSTTDKLDIFYANALGDEPKKIIDTIEFNKDKNGQIPDIDYLRIGRNEFMIYTSYDYNGKGFLKIKNFNDSSKDMTIHDKNIFGPLRVGTYYNFDENIKDSKELYLILYLTDDESETKIKLYNINEETTEDITDMIL